MKIITAIQILIKLFTIGYGAGTVRTTGRFTAPAAAGNSLARWLRTASANCTDRQSLPCRTLWFTFMMKYNDMKKGKTLRSLHANFPFSILNFPFLSSSSSSAFQRYRPAAPPKAARPAECHAILPDSRGSSRRSRAVR